MKSKGNSSIIIIWVLIDTWWNVNNISSRPHWNFVKVLIDTWWNVNIIFGNILDGMQYVLIDTWWNVNFSNAVTFVVGVPF